MSALIVIGVGIIGCNQDPTPSTRPVATVEATPVLNPVLLHLPGIAGAREIDRNLVSGITTGGVSAEIETYDWTLDTPGLQALTSREDHEKQAQLVADRIERYFREDSRRTIYISSHSGGCGIAVWALEKLPADVKVDSLLMLAPALSPGYDLSEALSHVRGRAYCFYSAFDPVLGYGTRIFGTIDGVKTEAAGRVSFTAPDAAEPAAYAKLMQIPYDPAWAQLRNLGDHIGPLHRPFARQIIGPLLKTGLLPILPPATSQPSSRPSTTQSTLAR